MKALIKQISPPFAIRVARMLIVAPKADPDILFDGDDEAFREALAHVKVYGEYGCGASTRWVAANSTARIFAVDSALPWIQSVQSQVGDRENMVLHWADLGPLADWGRPINYGKSDNFHDYTDWIWQQDQQPDCVLVDGRFRVCCFATSLKHGAAGATIIFDDYVERPHYHVIEELIRPIKLCGRQAIFKVPAKSAIDMDAIDKMIEHFRFVVD